GIPASRSAAGSPRRRPFALVRPLGSRPGAELYASAPPSAGTAIALPEYARASMALPDWLDPVYTAEEMRACDAWAIEEQGVSSLDLMERAGVGLARATTGVARSGPIRVVAGKGNNGGDGLVAARILREDGYEVDVLAT